MAQLIEPGNRIRIINPTLPSYSKEYVVAKPPSNNHEMSQDEIRALVWIQKPDNMVWFYPTSCEIIEKVKSVDVELCPECKGTGQIELLISVVRCKRCGGNK